MSTASPPVLPTTQSRRIGYVGIAITLAIVVAGLMWAKWVPYESRAHALAGTGTWDGKAIFGKAGTPGSAPSWAGMWAFFVTYVQAVWKAALVAVLVAAALEALVPRRLLLRVLARRNGLGQGLAGGLLALPGMMCTCCTAPVAIGLRRRGAPAGAAMAYWLANPLLNPAVLVFLGLTLPWQFVSTRAVIGAVVVAAAALVAARQARFVPTEIAPAFEDDPQRWSQLPGRYLRALARYLVVVVPEYVLLVLATGLLSGRLSNFAHLAGAAGPLSLLLVGVVGAALVIPTGGEIPVIVGLVAAGASTGVAGMLLITLPAVSAPSLVMVARSFTVRTTVTITGCVIAGGLLAAALLTVLP